MFQTLVISPNFKNTHFRQKCLSEKVRGLMLRNNDLYYSLKSCNLRGIAKPCVSKLCFTKPCFKKAMTLKSLCAFMYNYVINVQLCKLMCHLLINKNVLLKIFSSFKS